MKKRLCTLLLALLMLLSIVPGQCFAEEAGAAAAPAALAPEILFVECDGNAPPMLLADPSDADVTQLANQLKTYGIQQTATYTPAGGTTLTEAEIAALGQDVGRVIVQSGTAAYTWRYTGYTGPDEAGVYTLSFTLVTISDWGALKERLAAKVAAGAVTITETITADSELPEKFLASWPASAGQNATEGNEGQTLTYQGSTAAKQSDGRYVYTLSYNLDTLHKSIASAGAALRQYMKQRNEAVTIQLKCAASTDDAQKFMGDIMTEATKHTGESTEGDYLRWQYGGYEGIISMMQSGETTTFTFSYNISYYTTSEQETEMDTFARNFVGSDAIKKAATPYDKIKAIYDWLCTNVVYDYTNLNSPEYMLKHTAYAAAINHTAVCQGYAVLFYRLALECGIDARVIAGKGKGANGWEDHAWNIVKLGGNYYLLDATWDAGKTPMYYQYFLKGRDAGLFPNHNPYYNEMVGTQYFGNEYDYTALGVSSTNYDPQTAVSEQYDLNGGGFDISDLQCLFEYLSTGTVSSGTIDKTKADVNKDGQVNILDYQALYEAYKVWVSKAA